MKKIFTLIMMMFMLPLSLISCKVINDEYKFEVIDNQNILLSRHKNYYKEGEMITIKLTFFSGLKDGILFEDDYLNPVCFLYKNGTATPDYDGEFPVCQCIDIVMPSHDTTMYTTLNCMTKNDQIDFSKDRWIASTRSERNKYLNSFLKCFYYENITESDLKKQLGNPEKTDIIYHENYPEQHEGSVFSYFLDDDTTSNKRIEFISNINNKVIEYKIYS